MKKLVSTSDFENLTDEELRAFYADENTSEAELRAIEELVDSRG